MSKWPKKIVVSLVVVLGFFMAYNIASFHIREHRVEQVEIGMTLSRVSKLLGEGRPIDTFKTELISCPPKRKAIIFEGNANILLNGLWEDYIKVGVVEGVVCDVDRFGL